MIDELLKDSDKRKVTMKTIGPYLRTLALLLIGILPTKAQTIAVITDESSRKGRSMATVASGFPYTASLEYSHEIFDRFTLGFIVTKVPGGDGVGVRPEWTLPDAQNFQLIFRSPLFYYPSNSLAFCGRPWILVWPNIIAQWDLQAGRRFWAGAGGIAAACVHHLMGHEVEQNQTMEGTWHTATIGFSMPAAGGANLNLELSGVMKNFKLAARNDWVARIPVIFAVSVSVPVQ